MNHSPDWGYTFAVVTVLNGTSNIAPKSSEKRLTPTVVPSPKNNICRYFMHTLCQCVN